MWYDVTYYLHHLLLYSHWAHNRIKIKVPASVAVEHDHLFAKCFVKVAKKKAIG